MNGLIKPTISPALIVLVVLGFLLVVSVEVTFVKVIPSSVFVSVKFSGFLLGVGFRRILLKDKNVQDILRHRKNSHLNEGNRKLLNRLNRPY